MDWKQLLAHITGSLDEELRLCNAYLAAENRILRNQIRGRVQLTDAERKTLAEIGKQLGRQALEEIATIAHPDTILAWHRKLVTQPCDSTQPRTSIGRPRIDQELEDLVVRMAQENRSWGYDRMVGALANLDYQISDQTVGNILKRHGIPPAPQRKKTMTWREFIRIHMELLGATDFFMREVWSWFALVIASMRFFIHVGGRWGHAVGVAAHHTAQWILSLLTWLLAGPADGQRGGHVMTVAVRSRPILCAEGVQQYTLSVCTPPHDRAPLLQYMGTVVGMPAGHPRPIRDGPRPCRPRLGRPQQEDNRKAA
jgi:hypothetical protein